MINCERASFLTTKEELGAKLSFMERFNLRRHAAICAVCTEFNKQSEFINKLVKEVFSSDGNHKMSAEKKAEIQEELDNMFI